MLDGAVEAVGTSCSSELPCNCYYSVVRFSLLLLLLLAAPACYNTVPEGINKPAPDFTVKDSDRSVTLSQLRGRTVILNFWATWCPPCVQEMPSLVRLQKKLQDKNVTVLAVSVDDDAEAYHKFLTDHKIDLLTVREGGARSDIGVISPVTNSYGTFKLPESYIIDRDGMIRRKFIGAVDWNQTEIMEYLTRL
jgi:cytochrome c biogenesis protein CcmG/thiol:disulfide interchange protein DsbE